MGHESAAGAVDNLFNFDAAGTHALQGTFSTK